MNDSESIKETIRARESWRTYLKEDINESILNDFSNFIDNLEKSPFDNSKPRFKILSLEDSAEINKFATYGMIKNAPYYILGAIERSEYVYEHYGYLFEQIILKATELNLGTCWLGGTIDRKKVADAIDLKENEIIPAVTPLGYVESRRFMGKAVRWLIKSKKRKDWKELFFLRIEKRIKSLDKDDAGKFEMPLEMVRLGPSAKNRQTWRIIYERKGKKLHFFRVSSEKSARLDIAIAVCHFDLTCKEENIKGKWYFEKPNSLNSLIPQEWIYSISWQED
jgi:nitroreductase